MILDGFGKKVIENISGVAKDLFESFTKKPSEQTVTDWLGNELEKHLPDVGGTSFKDIATEIGKHIDKFDENMRDVEEAAKNGTSKDVWLRDQLKAYAKEHGMDKAGAFIDAASAALAGGNELAMEGLKNPEMKLQLREDALEAADDIPVGEKYDKFAVGQAIHKMVDQANLAGSAGAAQNAGIELVEQADIQPVANGNSLGEAMMEAPSGSALDNGMKTLAAGALKIAAHSKWIPFITKKTPISVICDTACYGVESVKTAWKVFTGKMSVKQSVEHMGRVTSAMIGKMCTEGASKAAFASIPIVGPWVGAAVGSVIGKTASDKVGQAVYSGFKKIQPVAEVVATGAYKAAKAVAEVGKKVFETGKKVVGKIFSFFGL